MYKISRTVKKLSNTLCLIVKTAFTKCAIANTINAIKQIISMLNVFFIFIGYITSVNAKYPIIIKKLKSIISKGTRFHTYVILQYIIRIKIFKRVKFFNFICLYLFLSPTNLFSSQNQCVASILGSGAIVILFGLLFKYDPHHAKLLNNIILCLHIDIKCISI